MAYEHHRAVWIAGDDGSGARRLASGYEPHIAPGGATVVYRDRTGTRVYAIPAVGGPRRRLLRFHVPRSRRFSVRIAALTSTSRRMAATPSSRCRTGEPC